MIIMLFKIKICTKKFKCKWALTIILFKIKIILMYAFMVCKWALTCFKCHVGYDEVSVREYLICHLELLEIDVAI